MNWLYKCYLLVVVLATSCVLNSHASKPCVLREYTKEHFVCVCNATYCDEISNEGSVPDGQFVHYTSTKAGKRFERTTGPVKDPGASNDEVQITIDSSSRDQQIIGFGGAFTDASGINIKSLSEGSQENLLRSYFSPEGIGFSLGRVPIGGADFSTHPYTYDDVTDDDDLSEFALAPEDLEYKIPMIKRAMAMSEKPIKLLSAAWSPPVWMKTNNEITGFAFLKEKYYQLWADYHIKFLDAYKEQGLSFWAMSTGNEPSNGIIPIMKFNSLGWTPKTQAKWVAENLGPTLNNSVHRDTKILALDDQRFMLPWWINLMMENKEAAKYISGIAVHWYWDNLLPATLLTLTHNTYPDKFLIATEACKGDRPWNYPKVYLGSWSRAEDYLADIIQDMNHWVTGWVDWNLALDLSGGPNWANNFVDAAIIVNSTADEFYKQPIYYAMGHFTKFVPEGSYHIGVTPKLKKGIYTTAFATPSGNIVAVLHNQRSSDKQVTINDPKRGQVSITIPKNSFNTVIF